VSIICLLIQFSFKSATETSQHDKTQMGKQGWGGPNRRSTEVSLWAVTTLQSQCLSIDGQSSS